MDELNSLLEGLPNAERITLAMRQRALSGAVIPDADGRLPGAPGYVATYDPYYAALQLIPFLRSQPVVTSAGSEGTSVTATPPDWDALEQFYRSMSIIVQVQGEDVLRIVPIPDRPHVKKTDMSGRGDYRYGDVNTDLG